MKPLSLIVTLVAIAAVNCSMCLADPPQLPLPESLAKDVPFPYTIPSDPSLRRYRVFSPNRPKLPRSVADWGLIERIQDSYHLKSVRVYGFGRYVDGKTIDWTTTDPKDLLLIKEGLAPRFVRRGPVSDFEPGGAQVGAGAHLGLLELTFEEGSLIVGVSQVEFYLNSFHGTTHGSFSSLVLANGLDLLLRRITGKGLEPHILADLSGEGDLKRAREEYEEIVTQIESK